MSDLISRRDVITSFRLDDDGNVWSMEDIIYRLEQFPSAQPEHHAENLLAYAHDMGVSIEQAEKELQVAQPERKKDTIQKFHDYQVEWLTSHCDLELEPVLESWVVRFLYDTANCYMMEVDT